MFDLDMEAQEEGFEDAVHRMHVLTVESLNDIAAMLDMRGATLWGLDAHQFRSMARRCTREAFERLVN